MHTLDLLDLLTKALVVLHLVGMAGVVGGWMAVVRNPRIVPAILHGALTAVGSGILLLVVTIARGWGVDYVQMGLHIGIGLAIAVLVFLNRSREQISKGLLGTIGGLGLANVVVAVLWL